MNAITKIEHWGDHHRVHWLVVLRAALGVFIVYKGAFFAMNLEQLQDMSTNLIYMSVLAAHYVLFAHLLGGPLIILGYYTRTACLIQVPVLIGAIFFINAPKGFMMVGNQSELEVSIITLVLLLVFSVMGAGKFSLDEIRRKREALENK